MLWIISNKSRNPSLSDKFDLFLEVQDEMRLYAIDTMHIADTEDNTACELLVDLDDLSDEPGN